jgi:Holliday junction resolvasome RuvABC ATP-dependent DNA helicase subunit
MNTNEPNAPQEQPTDLSNLRPQSLNDYIGQENIKKTLKMFIDAVKQR